MTDSNIPTFVHAKMEQASAFGGSAVYELIEQARAAGIAVNSYAQALLAGQVPGTIAAELVFDNYKRYVDTFKNGMLEGVTLALMKKGTICKNDPTPFSDYFQEITKPLVENFLSGLILLATGIDYKRHGMLYPELLDLLVPVHTLIFESFTNNKDGLEGITFTDLVDRMGFITIENYRKHYADIDMAVLRLITLIAGQAQLIHNQWREHGWGSY